MSARKRVVLTDIEGTTSSISFVKDVLFPYARRELPAFVRKHGGDPEVRRWLDVVAVELGGGFFVSDWTRQHANFFRSIQMTKSMLFVILSLIVAMAAFNIVATLVMVVKDKSRDIAILRTLGAAPRNVQAVFLVQGVMIGLAATSIWLGRNQSLYDFWFYITNFSRYPMEIYEGAFGSPLRFVWRKLRVTRRKSWKRNRPRRIA